MKIKYLGTGAYDGIPAPFCRCENCRRARELGGRNIRSHTQAMINDDLIIDLPPETHMRANLRGLDLANIKNYLITHVHEDHFYPTLITNLHPNFANLNEGETYTFYGTPDLNNFSDCYETAGRAVIKTVAPFTPFKVGRYTVTALKAMHPTDNPYLYIISDGAKTMLYAHDTGLLPEEDIEYLKNSGTHLDFISLDCTKGAFEDLNYPNHQCLGRNVATRERLMREGIIDERTTIVLNHFSHNGKSAVYDDLKPLAEKLGMMVSYDGMEIQV